MVCPRPISQTEQAPRARDAGNPCFRFALDTSRRFISRPETFPCGPDLVRMPELFDSGSEADTLPYIPLRLRVAGDVLHGAWIGSE